MIRRERDAELLNRIASTINDELFLSRYCAGSDWTAATSHCAVLSNGEDAFMAFEQTAERDWQVATMFAPSCRGKRAVQVGREMFDYMMPKWADLIFGSISTKLPHAIWFYRQLGGIQIPCVESGGAEWYPQDGEVLLAMRKPN